MKTGLTRRVPPGPEHRLAHFSQTRECRLTERGIELLDVGLGPACHQLFNRNTQRPGPDAVCWQMMMEMREEKGRTAEPTAGRASRQAEPGRCRLPATGPGRRFC